jgi:pilus assembly protein Flp/PilA
MKSREKIHVNNMLLSLYLKFRDLVHREEGQDLVEYALIVALIALAATVGMKSLANGINHAFDSVSVALSTDI